MKHYVSLMILACICLFGSAQAQRLGVKTNTLYLGTSTPNLGLEFRLGQQTSLSLHGGYNPFEFRSVTREDGTSMNPKLKHWLLMPELKYWFCRSFERSYIGLHGIYGDFNVGGLSFIPALKDYRYQGQAYGGGLSWGYQWAFGDRWGLEASVGIGYLHMRYKKYDCGACGDFLGEYQQNYFGPTKLALEIIYYIQ